MTDADRFKLLDKYKTPRFRLGQVACCEVRGKVVITGVTEAPIPWPVAFKGKGRHTLVLYRDLAKAVVRESTPAVCYWWGVARSTVWKWRVTLGVEPTNEGTSRLRRDHFAEPWGEKARRKAWAKAQDPERRRKIAEALRGKPKPPHMMEELRRSNLGRKLSAETRRKMSEAYRRHGAKPPIGRLWEPWELTLLGTAPDEMVAERTERSASAVQKKRSVLGIPNPATNTGAVAERSDSDT
jgi:hypothetical protein